MALFVFNPLLDIELLSEANSGGTCSAKCVKFETPKHKPP